MKKNYDDRLYLLISSELKNKLEILAKKKGLNLSDFVRMKLTEIAENGSGK